MSKPVLSIVVPVYNVGEWFVPCLESIVNQTVDKELLEVVLVDDGSTDGSEKICDEYAEKYPFVRAFHQPNSGYSAAPRNHGIEEAQGEYIFFHDADDIVNPEACERIVNHVREWDCDVLGLAEHWVWQETGKRSYQNPYVEAGMPNIPKGNRFMRPMIYAANCRKVIRRSLIMDNNLRFIKLWNDDILFAIQALACADTVSFASDYVYVDYIQRKQGSLVHNKQGHPVKSFDSRLAGIMHIADTISDKGVESDAYPFLNTLLFEHPVYKMLTTGMDDRDWEAEKKRLGEVWDVVGKYWTLDVAAEAKITERCVIDSLAMGEYDSLPYVRALAKRTSKRLECQKREAGTGADPTTPLIPHYKKLHAFEQEALAIRQLNCVWVFGGRIVKGTDGHRYAAGCMLVRSPNLNLQLSFRQPGKTGATVPCDYVLAGRGPKEDEAIGIWFADVSQLKGGVSGSRVVASVGDYYYEFDPYRKTKRLTCWRDMKTRPAVNHIAALQNAFADLSAADMPIPERMRLGMLFDGPYHQLIADAIDGEYWPPVGGWDADMKQIAAEWLPKADQNALRPSSKAVVNAINTRDLEDIPAIRNEAKWAAPKAAKSLPAFLARLKK